MNQLINKRELIYEIAVRTGYSKNEVSHILTEFANFIAEQASQCNMVKIAPGIKVGGVWAEGKKAYNVFQGKEIVLDPYVKPKFSFERTFRDRINGKRPLRISRSYTPPKLIGHESVIEDDDFDDDVYDDSVFEKVNLPNNGIEILEEEV